jgi:hypothetical protein
VALESLGYVTSRSGALLVADFGLFGAWEGQPPGNAIRAALSQGRYDFEHLGVPGVAIPHVPRDRQLPVSGLRIDAGPFVGLWQAIFVDFVDQPHAARTVEAGRIIVDAARAGFFDVDAVAAWQHDVPVDGRADVAFWGLHAEEVARRFNAGRLEEDAFGWMDLPIQQAQQAAQALDALRNTGELRFAYDFRPHSHHYVLMKQVRSRPTESGVIGIGGQQAVCGFMTSWGDGEFPVMLDFDEAGTLTRCGIFLATELAQENLRQVNG